MNTSSTEILTVNNNKNEAIGIPVMQKGKPKTRQMLIGWDKPRSFTFLGLALCFVVWACVYFPLIMTQQSHESHH